MSKYAFIFIILIGLGLLRCAQPTTNQLTSPTPSLLIEYPTSSSDLTKAEQAALDLVLDRLGEERASNVRVLKVHTAYGDGRTIHSVDLQQTYQGIPLSGKVILIDVENDEIISENGVYYPYINVPADVLPPNITMDEAILKVVEAIGIEGEYWFQPHFSELIWYSVPTKARHTRYALTWKVVVRAKCPLGHWNVFVEAETGAVLSFHNEMIMKPTTNGCPTPQPLPRLTPVPAPAVDPTFIPSELLMLDK